MKYSKTTHFWAWFQHHQEIFLQLPKKNKEHINYWMWELFTHVAAYQRFLRADVFVHKSDLHKSQIIFTANGNCKYFGLVERLVAKSPVVPGWEFIALYPPNTAGWFMQEEFNNLDIDPSNLWFFPPRRSGDERRLELCIYAEVYNGITNKFCRAVDMAVFNVLGERTYGQEIDWIYTHDLLELKKEQRSGLVNLQELPGYIQSREVSAIIVNEQGIMEKRK